MTILYRLSVSGSSLSEPGGLWTESRDEVDYLARIEDPDYEAGSGRLYVVDNSSVRGDSVANLPVDDILGTVSGERANADMARSYLRDRLRDDAKDLATSTGVMWVRLVLASHPGDPERWKGALIYVGGDQLDARLAPEQD